MLFLPSKYIPSNGFCCTPSVAPIPAAIGTVGAPAIRNGDDSFAQQQQQQQQQQPKKRVFDKIAKYVTAYPHIYLTPIFRSCYEFSTSSRHASSSTDSVIYLPIPYDLPPVPYGKGMC